jgi:N,N'-diacetyllegionaminate synthase
VTARSLSVGTIDTAVTVLIVAEIGNNHEGDFGRAREMLDAAADAGANAVKFQTIVPERLVARSEAGRLAQLRRFALKLDQFGLLAEQAKRRNVQFLSTPFDTQSVRDLEPLVPAFKVASGDNDYSDLLEAVAATAGTITRTWARRGLRDPGLCLLHCAVAYPCPPEQANLKAIQSLAHLGFPVGYSDHTLGIDAAAFAVVLGARVVEKHFTLDHKLSDFRDHSLSADPAQMAELVRRIRTAETLVGDGEKRVMPAEEPALVGARRGLAVERDLPAGHVLTNADMIWLRPRHELGPGQELNVLGRRLRVAKEAGSLLALTDLAS